MPISRILRFSQEYFSKLILSTHPHVKGLLRCMRNNQEGGAMRQ